MEYLLTKLGDFWGIYVGVHIPAPWFASGRGDLIMLIQPLSNFLNGHYSNYQSAGSFYEMMGPNDMGRLMEYPHYMDTSKQISR